MAGFRSAGFERFQGLLDDPAILESLVADGASAVGMREA